MELVTTSKHSVGRNPLAVPPGVEQKTWNIFGLLAGYERLYSAADAWVKSDRASTETTPLGFYHPAGTADALLYPMATYDGYLPVRLGRFTTLSVIDEKLVSHELRGSYKSRARTSAERELLFQGFVDKLAFKPENTFLSRQIKKPQLVIASFMIDRARLRTFDPIRDDKNIIAGTSALHRTNDGAPFLGTPIARAIDRAKLQAATPIPFRGEVYFEGGFIQEVQPVVLPTQQRPII